MRSSFAKRTIVRLRFPTHTDQGASFPDTSATPTLSDIPGCWYEPTSSTTVRDGRLAVRTGYTVDAPAGIDLTAHDRVRIDGVDYELDGDPLRIPSPSGRLDSTRFVCYRWEG